jgi:hypothetical protein
MSLVLVVLELQVQSLVLLLLVAEEAVEEPI